MIVITMLRHDITAGFFVPVELLLDGRADGVGASLVYVRPPSLIAIENCLGSWTAVYSGRSTRTLTSDSRKNCCNCEESRPQGRELYRRGHRDLKSRPQHHDQRTWPAMLPAPAVAYRSRSAFCIEAPRASEIHKADRNDRKWPKAEIEVHHQNTPATSWGPRILTSATPPA